MGCIYSKGTRVNEYAENNGPSQEDTKTGNISVSSSKRDEAAVEVDGISNQLTNNNSSSSLVISDENKKKSAKVSVLKVCRLLSLTNGEKGAQVIAGWPSWLTAVAGEAISGWVPRSAESFEKLEKVGQGTYSNVYKARDLDTNKIVALKKVRFANRDPESVRFMAREIIILRRLDHPNVMKLEGIITSKMSGSLYLVFEYMEHDLSGLLATPGVKFTETQIKCYMKQLLGGLEHCHSHGVLHRDIKGSNLLIDKRGNLKIGDFGLATFFNPPQEQLLTSCVVTLWYRPPELLLGATSYGVSVDLWSTGCILAEFFAGKPIMPGRTEVEQLHKIFKLCGSPSEDYWKRSKLPHATIFKPQQPYKRCFADTFKDFPSTALSLLDVLLAVEPDHRGTASSAIGSEFFTTDPLPCDPSSLPKYPSIKNFDIKAQDTYAKRRRGAGGKGHAIEATRKTSRGSRAIPAPDANAELLASMQKRKGQCNTKSICEHYIPAGDGGSDLSVEPSEGLVKNVNAHLEHSTPPVNSGSLRSRDVSQAFVSAKNTEELRTQTFAVQKKATDFSRCSNSFAGRDRDTSQSETALNPQWPEHRFDPQHTHRDDPSNHSLSRQGFSSKGWPSSLESAAGHFQKEGQIHYSGPLITAGGNVEDMLREHERQIQKAVRKTRMDKTKANKAYNEDGHTESLQCHGRNGR